MTHGCVVCSMAHEPEGDRLDRRGLCRQCRDAYALGRKEALAEALASALRVRGEPRSSKMANDAADEHQDGTEAAAGAIVTFVRKLLTRRYPPRKK